MLFRDLGKWLIPFEKQDLHKNASIQLELNGCPVCSCVDTGSTRVAASTQFMQDTSGKKYLHHLTKFAISKVSDAQGQQIKIIGFFYATITFPQRLSVRYPIMVFESNTKDLLLGLQFLQQVNVVVLPNQGLLNYDAQHQETLYRLNYDVANIKCLARDNFIVQPQQVMSFPALLSFDDKISPPIPKSMIGQQVVTSSEELEPETDITDLKCPPAYSFIQPNYELLMVIDNSENLEALYM